MPDAPLAPLPVLLAVMQQKWEAGDWDAAAALARIAASYLYGRRAAVRDTPAADLQHLSDADFDRLIGGPEGEGAE